MFKDIDINALITMLDQTDISTVRIKSADFEIVLSRDQLTKFEAGYGDTAPQTRHLPDPSQTNHANLGKNDKLPPTKTVEENSVPLVAQTPGIMTKSTERMLDNSVALHIVKAPLIGVFYRAPAPGAPPFVELNQKVDPETTIGLLETMKVFTAIQAGKRGVVKEILADNGQVVELDAPILAIEQI